MVVYSRGKSLPVQWCIALKIPSGQVASGETLSSGVASSQVVVS